MKTDKKAWNKRMRIYIVGLVAFTLLLYLGIQGVRCASAVGTVRENLKFYAAVTAKLSYGDMLPCDDRRDGIVNDAAVTNPDMNLKERAKEIKTALPAVFIALKDKDTPIIAKVLAGMTIGYALSPIDIVPDFIPVLGYLDDIIILPLLVALTVKLIPQDIWERSREKSIGMWEHGKPKKWYYAIPVITVWIVLMYIVIKAIWQ